MEALGVAPSDREFSMVLKMLEEIKAAILRQDRDVAENRDLIVAVNTKIASAEGGLKVLGKAVSWLGLGTLAGCLSGAIALYSWIKGQH